MRQQARRSLEGHEVVLLVVLVLAFVLLAWPASRVGLPHHDEAFLLYGIDRVAVGLTPIADFQSYDPGRYYLLLPADLLGGWRGVFFAGRLLTAAAVLVLVRTVARAFRPPERLFLVGFLTLLLLLWTSLPRYKAVEQAAALLVMAALVHLLQERTSRAYLVTGLMIGMTAVVGRNHGLYALVAFVLVVPLLSVRTEGSVPVSRGVPLAALGTAMGWSPVALLLAFSGDFREHYLEALVRNTTQGTNISLPIPWPWSGVGLDPVAVAVVLFPVMYGLGLAVAYAQRRRVAVDPLLAVVAAASALGAPYLHYLFSRADPAYVAHVAPPAAVITVVLLQRMWHRAAGVSLVAATLVWTFLATGAILAWPASSPAVRTFLGLPPLDAVEVAGQSRLLNVFEQRRLDDVRDAEALIPPDAVVAALPRGVDYYLLSGRTAPIHELYMAGKSSPNRRAELVDAYAEVDWVVLEPEAYGGNPTTAFREAYPLGWAALAARCVEVVPEGRDRTLTFELWRCGAA